MEKGVKERIREIFNFKKTSVNAVSKSLGLKQNTLNRQINGDTTIPVDTILAIIGLYPDVCPEWLLTGEGPMLKETGGITLQDTPGFELSGLKQDVKRVDAELCKAKEEIKALCGVIELLKKENTELHKQLIAEKERLINVLMEKK